MTLSHNPYTWPGWNRPSIVVPDLTTYYNSEFEIGNPNLKWKSKSLSQWPALRQIQNQIQIQIQKFPGMKPFCCRFRFSARGYKVFYIWFNPHFRENVVQEDVWLHGIRVYWIITKNFARIWNTGRCWLLPVRNSVLKLLVTMIGHSSRPSHHRHRVWFGKKEFRSPFEVE